MTQNEHASIQASDPSRHLCSRHTRHFSSSTLHATQLAAITKSGSSTLPILVHSAVALHASAAAQASFLRSAPSQRTPQPVLKVFPLLAMQCNTLISSCTHLRSSRSSQGSQGAPAAQPMHGVGLQVLCVHVHKVHVCVCSHGEGQPFLISMCAGDTLMLLLTRPSTYFCSDAPCLHIHIHTACPHTHYLHKHTCTHTHTYTTPACSLCRCCCVLLVSRPSGVTVNKSRSCCWEKYLQPTDK